MMTSKSEGWGLTLTESQQFGVVPVVFDTVAPFHEIITNEVNGILVEENQFDIYVQEMISLMKDEKKRKTMAIEGYAPCKKFSQDNIAEDWYKLIQELRETE